MVRAVLVHAHVTLLVVFTDGLLFKASWVYAHWTPAVLPLAHAPPAPELPDVLDVLVLAEPVPALPPGPLAPAPELVPLVVSALEPHAAMTEPAIPRTAEHAKTDTDDVLLIQPPAGAAPQRARQRRSGQDNEDIERREGGRVPNPHVGVRIAQRRSA